jgi:DNA-binding response OmpR family regulator
MTRRTPILLVEPDKRLAHLTARYLAGHDLDATILDNAQLIFDELLKRRYACVVLDITAELEFTCKLCEGLGVPVVAVAGRNDTSPTLPRTRFTPHELLARIQRALQDERLGA